MENLHAKISFSYSVLNMAPAEDIVSLLLTASGVPHETVQRVLEQGPSECSGILSSLNLSECLEHDVYGLNSSQLQSAVKRRRLTGAIPKLTVESASETLLLWLKSLSQCRFRPVRSAASISAFYIVEQLLISSRQALPQERRAQLSFCEKLCMQVLLPRCRDTCPVIRQIGAEYISKCTKVVFGKRNALFDALSHLVMDDMRNVRMEVIKGLSLATPLAVPKEFMCVLIKAFFARCEEVHEQRDEESKRTYLFSEIVAHAKCFSLIILGSNGEALESLGQDAECLFQVVWDTQLPLEARNFIASIISKHVLGCLDILTKDPDEAIDILSEFIREYSPSKEISDLGVWESFVSEPSQLLLQAAIARSHIPLIEAISLIIDAKQQTHFSLDFSGFEHVFTLLADIRILNSLIRFSKYSNAFPCASFHNAVVTLVSPETSTPYTVRYLAYRLWHTLSACDVGLAKSLAEWGTFMRSLPFLKGNLENLHAFESAVPLTIPDLGLADKLLKVSTDDSLALICALDLAVIQFLKSEINDALKSQLQSALQKVLISHQHEIHVAFFCKYRLLSLCSSSQTNTKTKRIIEIAGTNLWDGAPPSTYIISSLIEREHIDAAVIPYIE